MLISNWQDRVACLRKENRKKLSAKMESSILLTGSSRFQV
jgi:hypothetical protein